MRYIFIINKYSTNDIEFIYNQICYVCQSLGINYVIELNQLNNPTEDILKKYQDTENIIMAVGGDGMINRVVNGIANTNNILGYIPYGTGNDFHKSVIETITDEITPIDLIKINEKYFVNIACFGIDADIANDDEIIHNKLIPKSQRYNASVIYHFLKYQGRNLKIYIDDKTLEEQLTTLVIANARYYGGGYKVGTNSIMNDGLMEVYLVKMLPKLRMAKSILGMKDGKHEKLKEVTKISTTNLTIESDIPIKSNIDGEILEADSFNINLIHNGIKLYNDQELIKKILKK